VLASARAADGFDARGDARSRTYCYRVLQRRERSVFERGRALWWPHRLDRDALHACAALLPGTHDFTAFTPTETDHVRFSRDVLGARWEERGDLLEFWIEADTFMRHMNRALVGTMLEVAGGRRSVENFAALLEGRSRADAGPTLHEPLDLEFAIGLEHGVRVDRERADDLLHGGQPVTGAQRAVEQRLAHLLDQLHVGRHVRSCRQVEGNHPHTYLSRRLDK